MILYLFGALEANLFFFTRRRSFGIANFCHQALNFTAQPLDIFFEDFRPIDRICALLKCDGELFRARVFPQGDAIEHLLQFSVTRLLRKALLRFLQKRLRQPHVFVPRRAQVRQSQL